MASERRSLTSRFRARMCPPGAGSSDYTVTQYTTPLRPGVRSQVEYRADGQDVWVTRIVRDATGNVIHRDAYYAHDARMIGVILIAEAATTPTPSS